MMKKLLGLFALAAMLYAAAPGQDILVLRRRQGTVAASPCICTLIDNFNRANEGPPMTNWARVDQLYGSNARGLAVVSNQAENSASSVNADYRSATTYGPNAEVCVTIAAMGGGADTSGVLFGMTNPTGVPQGYMVLASKALSTLQVVRVDGDSSTATVGASIAQTIADGDSLCVRREANDVNVYYKVGAGPYTFKATRTDSTYTSAGYFGLWADGGSAGIAKFDNLAGGTL